MAYLNRNIGRVDGSDPAKAVAELANYISYLSETIDYQDTILKKRIAELEERLSVVERDLNGN